MTDAEKIAFKNRLKQAGLAIIQQRIDAARMAIDEAQQAANQEEKSSAGDKYETGRAMGHLQKEMHGRQMAEQLKELAILHAVNIDKVYSHVVTGAFIHSPGTGFFISAGLGKQRVDDRLIFFLSPQAPLAGLLADKNPGDTFLFGGKEILIEEIF